MHTRQASQIAFLFGRIALGAFYLYYAFDQFAELNFWAG